MAEDGVRLMLCVRVRALPGHWWCVYWVLSAGRSEGVKEYLLILATHLFSWKSLDCFCSAPRLPLSVSLPLMKLQMNWSTYWLLSFSPLTGLLSLSTTLSSFLSACLCLSFSLSLLISLLLPSLLSLPRSLSLAVFMSLCLHLMLPLLFITFVTLSTPYFICLFVYLFSCPSHLLFPLLPRSPPPSFPRLSSSTHDEGNVGWRCCLPAAAKSILIEWLRHMTYSNGLISLQRSLCPFILGPILKKLFSTSDFSFSKT